jgi:hypothetical protein
MEKRYINSSEGKTETEIQRKHLGRMIKLALGEIDPTSENERRFLYYTNDESALPTNNYEKVWQHYMMSLDRDWRPHPSSYILHAPSTICKRCNGDGGVNNGCPKCDGRGWITPE